MPRPVHSLIVEFVGTPGVGKSFVVERLTTRLIAAGHDAHDGLAPVASTLPSRLRARRKVQVTLGEMLRAPGGVAEIVIALRRSGQRPRAMLRLGQNWFVTRSMLRAARQRGGINLFDQAIVQQLCSVGVAGDWRDALTCASPGRHLLGPDIVVHVTARVDTTMERLATRPAHHSRVEHLNVEEQCVELHRQADELTAIIAAWQELAEPFVAPRVIEFSNDGDLSDTALDALVAAVTAA